MALKATRRRQCGDSWGSELSWRVRSLIVALVPGENARFGAGLSVSAPLPAKPSGHACSLVRWGSGQGCRQPEGEGLVTMASGPVQHSMSRGPEVIKAQ